MKNLLLLHSLPRLRAVLTATLAASFLTAAAWATLTAPNLRLDSVEAEEIPGAGAWVRVKGDFPFEATTGKEYGLQLFIRELKPGDRFVCFSTRWGPMEGADAKLVEKGLSSKEAFQVGSFATPSTTARFVEFAPGHIEVQLPTDFPDGPLEAQLFVIYGDAPLFSNPIEFEIVRSEP